MATLQIGVQPTETTGLDVLREWLDVMAAALWVHHRNRGEMVECQQQETCSKCDQTIYAGEAALWFPGRDKLACLVCAGVVPKEGEAA